ncbi:MAG: hypothetical protein ACP5N3_05505 [Candidatus Nanoarchaeia archaeon]
MELTALVGSYSVFLPQEDQPHGFLTLEKKEEGMPVAGVFIIEPGHTIASAIKYEMLVPKYIDFWRKKNISKDFLRKIRNYHKKGIEVKSYQIDPKYGATITDKITGEITRFTPIDQMYLDKLVKK